MRQPTCFSVRGADALQILSLGVPVARGTVNRQRVPKRARALSDPPKFEVRAAEVKRA